MAEIRPTGTIRVAGWLLVIAGTLVALIVTPIFTLGGALDESGTKWLISFIGDAAPWVGLAGVVAGVAMVAMASKRAAANREAAQRAALDEARRAGI